MSTPSSVIVESAPAAHLINVRLRRGDAQTGHQLRFPLRVLHLVTFGRDGMANASGVREPRVPAPAANQHCQRVVQLLHQVREAVGLHLVHLAQEVPLRLQSNRHGPQLPTSVDAPCSATMQTCMCASFTCAKHTRVSGLRSYSHVCVPILPIVQFTLQQQLASHRHGEKALPYVARASSYFTSPNATQRETPKIRRVFQAPPGPAEIIALGFLVQCFNKPDSKVNFLSYIFLWFVEK